MAKWQLIKKCTPKGQKSATSVAHFFSNNDPPRWTSYSELSQSYKVPEILLMPLGETNSC